MKKIFILLPAMLIFMNISAQFVYKIKADSVLITNDSCTAELNLENSTKSVKGFLYNKGNGRTEFRKIVKFNDSTIIIGEDTLVIRGGITATNGLSLAGSEARLGQTYGAAGDPALLQEHREMPTNGNNIILRYGGGLDAGNVTLGYRNILIHDQESATQELNLRPSSISIGDYSGNSWTFFAAITLPNGTTSTAIANQITIELICLVEVKIILIA